MRLRLLLIVMLLAWHTVAAQRYVQVWHSDRPLWAHALELAPGKTRPQMNYAKATFADGVSR